jgi:hypothetical protein
MLAGRVRNAPAVAAQSVTLPQNLPALPVLKP